MIVISAVARGRNIGSNVFVCRTAQILGDFGSDKVNTE